MLEAAAEKAELTGQIRSFLADALPQLARVAEQGLRSRRRHSRTCYSGRREALTLASPPIHPSRRYIVAVRGTYNALAMLAANQYVRRPGTVGSYSVIWQQAGAY